MGTGASTQTMSRAASSGEQAAAPVKLACPSAQPDWKGAMIFGVVEGSVGAPRTAYLDRTLPVLAGILAMTAPVAPTEVLRIAAPCANGACAHFRDQRCHLAEKIVAGLPAVVDDLPQCAIRPSCRWFAQHGAEACSRCPQIVTTAPPFNARMIEITDPAV
jgi:hypothetical protein